MNRIQKANHVAKLNPFNSVVKVKQLKEHDEDILLIGVKNVEQVPYSIVLTLENTGRYKLHTFDAYAHGGRAIDLMMMNPITGNYMTGSSSGTAVNVLLNINDVGIGVDGGGSVLAPAMSLNLFAFISPLLEQEHMKQFSKKSTDGIWFRPSLGIMSKDYTILMNTIDLLLNRNECSGIPRVLVNEADDYVYPFATEKIIYPSIDESRQKLIQFLQQQLPMCDFMISYEGPVDLEGFGDSIFGHFDARTQEIQKRAKKGLIRVINMSEATSIVIPDTKLGCAFVLCCETKIEKISKMLTYAKRLIQPEDKLIQSYFGNLDLYFNEGFQEYEKGK